PIGIACNAELGFAQSSWPASCSSSQFIVLAVTAALPQRLDQLHITFVAGSRQQVKDDHVLYLAFALDEFLMRLLKAGERTAMVDAFNRGVVQLALLERGLHVVLHVDREPQIHPEGSGPIRIPVNNQEGAAICGDPRNLLILELPSQL